MFSQFYQILFSIQAIVISFNGNYQTFSIILDKTCLICFFVALIKQMILGRETPAAEIDN